ncbi:MAG: hypothetical protein IJB17_01710 [Oscillospiraceae bacterium]|nr:hypothetical protein [Oscillospiraceae bacterium]
MLLAKKKLSLSRITLFAVLGALTFGAKMAMSALPNIEPVSLMVMLFAVVLGLKALYPIYVYVFLEILVWGLGTWNVMYLYIWAILAALAWLLRKAEHPLVWALLSGSFGLCFGALCAPVDVCIGGFGYAAAKWASGIPFDIAHCVGNFVIALLLFVPMRRLLTRLYQKL